MKYGYREIFNPLGCAGARWALRMRDRGLIQQSLMRLLASSAMAVTLFVGAAHAEQNDGWYVFGKGAHSTHCSDFLQAVDVERKARIVHPAPAMTGYSVTYTDEFRRFADFADGFLSGTNFASENERMTGQGTEVWSRALWIKNWCQQHPLEEYITALIALRAYLVTQSSLSASVEQPLDETCQDWFAKPTGADVANGAEIIAYVNAWCRRHPAGRLIDAVNAFDARMQKLCEQGRSPCPEKR